MSALHLSQIEAKVKELFDRKLDLNDLGTHPSYDHFLSRALAAYSVHTLTQCSLEDAAASDTDGENDNGIDSIYFDKSENKLYFVQSKWIKSGGAGEPESGEVKKFRDGILDFFNLRFERFNVKVQRRITDFRTLLLDPRVKYVAVLTYTGTSSLAPHASQTINDLLDEVNDAGEMISFILLNQSKLHESLLKTFTGDPIELTIALREWGKTDSPTGYYGQANAKDIADFYTTHRSRLFKSNIRGLLGSTEVNQEIQKTIASEPESFWFFNNGITIIANTIEKAAAHAGERILGIFKCIDAQIVNGAQTVSTLGGAVGAYPDNLSRAWVPVRIISLANSKPDFGAKITRANNTQNRIEGRDFVSQDPEQTRIKSELLIEGVNYILLRSSETPESECDFEVTEATTALACANSDLSMAVQAKREIGRFWEDLTRPPYTALFNPSVNGIVLNRCVTIQREIDNALELIIANKSGTRGLAAAVHGNRFISHLVFESLPNVLKKSPTEWEKEYSKLEIGNRVQDAHELVCRKLEQFFPNSILTNLFKNLSRCRELKESLSGPDTEELFTLTSS